MKLTKEEIDSLIIKVGYLELYPELSNDIALGISCMQDYKDTIDSWENQEDWDELNLDMDFMEVGCI
jgi:hypothetical protein